MSSSTEKQSNGRQQKGIHAGFKKAWRAIKNAFSSSGKSEVVSIPSSSHSEPSDVEEDLFIQTELRLFKQVCDQDVGDVLSGSCNVDHTLVEYTADPQSGSSGLHSAAPDQQPEHKTNTSKKKGRRVKRAWRAIMEAFTRSRKINVVPGPSHSHSDPCDLKEDLQPGPSGLQSEVPEETADKYPEQQSQCSTKKTKKKGRRAGFKKVWRALKGTFSHSGKNKVVPFSLTSHLEPGGVEEDPLFQTELQVLKPVGDQDMGDFLPGACNGDRTPFEYKADHQPDPSGLHLAVSEEPGDHQPGPSGLQSAVSEEPDDHQPVPSGLKSAVSGESADHQPRSFSVLYELGSKLGSGSYGTVFEGISRSDGQKVAIKCIEKRTEKPKIYIPWLFKPMFREVAINLQLHKPEICPYIVQMFDWFEEEDHLILILEYPQPCFTLYDFVLDPQWGMDETLARLFMRQAAIAAKHWIDHDVTHGDMHMGNVLVNTEMLQIKFIDFGYGRLITQKQQRYGYCDRARAVTSTVSGLGLLLYEMVYGFKISKECTDLINWSTSLPACRPTLEEFMDHKWFKPG